MHWFKKYKYHFLWIVITSFIVFLDQVTKFFALAYLQAYHPVDIFPGLSFTLAFNKGAAFSFLSNAGGWQVWFFLGLSVGVSCWLVYLLVTGKSELANSKIRLFSFIFILAGALGNFIDRVSYGYVIDFIDVYIKTYHWPIFNLADSAITCGALLFLYDSIKSDNKKS